MWWEAVFGCGGRGCLSVVGGGVWVWWEGVLGCGRRGCLGLVGGGVWAGGGSGAGMYVGDMRMSMGGMQPTSV